MPGGFLFVCFCFMGDEDKTQVFILVKQGFLSSEESPLCAYYYFLWVFFSFSVFEPKFYHTSVIYHLLIYGLSSMFTHNPHPHNTAFSV